MLQANGRNLKHITLNIYPNGPISLQSLSSFINRHCPNAELEVNLHALIKDDWEFSFENAGKVAIHRCMLRHSNTTWFTSFPRMRRLEVIDAFDFGIIGHSFPSHLTSFMLRLAGDSFEESDLYEFFRLNPQLRILEVPLSRSNQFLQFINEMLPNLEALTIGAGSVTRSRSHDIVRFEHVRHFTWTIPTLDRIYWDVSIASRFPTIQFDRLESIVLDTEKADAAKRHIDAIIRNEGLNTVNIGKCELNPRHLARLVDSLPELKEITIGWMYRKTLPRLRHLLAQQTRLETVNIVIIDQEILGVEDILRQIPSMWEWMNGTIENKHTALRFVRRGISAF